jgi:hypothetical protein
MTNVIPLDPKKRILASLRPASLSEAQAAVAVLAKALPIMPSIQDPPAFKGIMAEFLAPYPADVLMEAVNQAIEDLKHMPSIHEMVELCKRLVVPRHAELRRLERAENEEQQKQREADERAVEAEREAQRAAEDEARRQAQSRWLQRVEARARECLGDAAPLPGDVALADGISQSLVSRGGSRISWQAALERGEPWAAKFCRQMALAERTRRALEQGRISWTECLAIGKLISRDEAAARSEVEKAEPRDARRRYAGPPPESFWSALWKVHKTCGLDVPRSKDDDAVAAAVENLKHLTGLAELADVREILDRKQQEAWEARGGRLKPAREQQSIDRAAPRGRRSPTAPSTSSRQADIGGMFPQRDGGDAGLFLGLHLVANGSVAIFCGRKDSAAKVSSIAV